MNDLATILKAAAGPFLLALLAAAMCYAAAGTTLGFYLGPVALVSVILPAIVAGETHRTRALLTTAGVIDGVGVVWLVAAIGPQATLGQWLACYVTLTAYAFALCGAVLLLRRAIGGIGSAAIVTVMSIAWLAWPVWLSPRTTAPVVAWLAPAHPLFAINHVFIELGVWTQQKLMYRLTTLGQDVAFALPRSIWPCIGVHAAVALTVLLPARTSPTAAHVR